MIHKHTMGIQCYYPCWRCEKPFPRMFTAKLENKGDIVYFCFRCLESIEKSLCKSQEDFQDLVINLDSNDINRYNKDFKKNPDSYEALTKL